MVFYKSKNTFAMGIFLGNLAHINYVVFFLFKVSISAVEMEFLLGYFGGYQQMEHISNDRQL